MSHHYRTIVGIAVPVFDYKAFTAEQETRKGTIDRDSARHARQALRDLGLRVVEITQARPDQTGGLRAPRLFRKSWDHWVAGFTGELGTLLSVGMPLLDALSTLISQYKGKPKTFVLHLKDEVSSGVPLAEAMGRQPLVFDVLCTQMVAVGESTGNLDSVLSQLSDFKRRSLEFKDKVFSALLYPLVVLLVSVGVSIFLMTVVVPMLLENLQDSGRALPLPTRILKSVSDVLVGHGWWLAILSICVVTVVMLALKTYSGRRFRDQVLLKIPILGPMGQKQELARVSLIISTLLRSGIEFVKAIEITVGTTKNVLLREALSDCASRIESGSEIGDALQKWSYFPPLVTQVFTVGQKSGRMEEMLLRLSRDFDSQVESTSARLATVLEPVLILILSFFVGFILFATLLPILEAGNVL